MTSQESGASSCSAEELGNDAHQSDTTLSQEIPTLPPTSSDDKDSSGVQDQKEVWCQYFVMGKCRFGNKCRLFHSELLMGNSEAASANKTDEENEEKSKKKKVKVKQEEKEVNKKPRMRTADDVISRVLWDPSVDSSEFVVGYVDRFLGVLERPFCDFNWETNPCDCDYTTELALPRHRIQYFTYRGQRVWDRHSRMDRVFGSTGQALAPPFGGEGEVEDAAEEPALNEDGLVPVVSGQEQTDEECCTVTANLENETQTENHIHTLESQPQSTREQRGLQEINSVQTSSAAVEMEGPTNEDEKKHEDLSACVEAVNMNDEPDAELEHKDEKPSGRPPKKRPTHFVTFRANTPSILSGFTQLQEELTAVLPACAPYWSLASSLHVTLCLLVLPGPEEVEAAVEVLRRFARWDRNPPVAVTFPLKLKHFNGRVLYLSPQPHLRLQQLNAGLQEAYKEQGLLHRQSYNPRYHLTLAKINDMEAERIFMGVENLKVGKGLNFGRLPVNTLHLCAMGGCVVDGFYDIVCTVTLR
ncbi:leukocyte receptor cluster member 9 [Periophthalmus magnuspinnatus]|uniref:leukocyte receptor cluster member 9 n=1 Tax=Periophthalmus magnuspinnatus TaxID=409849 RepID=UPI00145BF4AA|nr:leukocyte receptor cluster member 9 [Periophthalmus magnuspinnatus]